ncbi:LuxR C-terminal-related transcriptional regulator [Amycolatopsis sp. EV170708-02-1]|uniref:ATP-binding protein n=1 Tax=Amycolatopsis sp. EV170708-02-1 TaxID=2919322 RepID=UPI0028F45EB2|nr:LuxR C-terminal-related transcriptional regulator [Amycolatopsis sp. EV170708-02-1]
MTPCGVTSLARRTSYIDRAQLTTRALELLNAGPVVTLTGAGGVGKTRLAAAVAETVSGKYPDGVTFVELAEVRNVELLPNVVAERLGLYDQSARQQLDVVADFLRSRRQLLVLDNCEHVLETGADMVAALVAACPKLNVLTTSRQSLGVLGEQVLVVPPLSVPDGEAAGSAAELETYEAPRLFADRARAVLPAFEITDGNCRDIAAICRGLGGLPLAIELAAVRLRVLSVSQLRTRLADPLSLLSRGRRDGPARHRTLRATIEWSHALCSEHEQRVLARASVFSGGFALAAAEWVCAGDGIPAGDVLDLVHGLIDKSLLTAEEAGGELRYSMLETLREYGAERLAETGETERVARLHRAWCADLTARYAAGWIGPDQVAWLRRISLEHANLRAALEYCATAPGEAVVGLRMINQLDVYWSARGLLNEAHRWLDRQMAAAPPDTPEWPQSLLLRAWYSVLRGDADAAAADVRVSRELAERTGGEVTAAYAEAIRATAVLYFGTEPVDWFGTAREVFRRHGLTAAEAYAEFHHRHATAFDGDLETAREQFAASIAAAEATGELYWRSWDWWALSVTEELHGDPAASERAALESFRLQQVLGNRSAEPHTVVALGCAATHRGDMIRAATLFGIGGTMWAAIGTDPRRFGRFTAHNVEVTARVVKTLGLDEVKRHYRFGKSLSRQDAVRYVLEGPASPAARASSAPLSAREFEIAELVTRGLTNRQIAAELFISPRTADTHLSHIYTKLGVSSRAELAAWVVRRADTQAGDPNT